MKSKKLTKKQQELQSDWEKVQASHKAVPKFAGKYGSSDMQVKRKFNIQTLAPAGGARQISNSGLNVRVNTPMGSGGTIPYDASLEAAKAGLAGRTGALYNKGGMAFISDADLAEMTTGSHRRR